MREYKVAILLPYELDRGPSQRFRWEQWIAHLEATGLGIELVTFSTPSIGVARRNGSRWRSSFLFAMRYLPWLVEVFRAARRSDLVVVHRNAALTGPPIA